MRFDLFFRMTPSIFTLLNKLTNQVRIAELKNYLLRNLMKSNQSSCAEVDLLAYLSIVKKRLVDAEGE